MFKPYQLAILTLFLATSLVAKEERVSLIFAGDAMVHTPQIEAAKTANGYNFHPTFEKIKSRIFNADIAGVNLETTLGTPPYSGYPLFISPKEYAKALHHGGFNLFFTANNHALDSGKKGLEQTIDVIRKEGVKQTGTFKTPDDRALNYPLMLIKNGIRIAFLNYTYGTNGLPVRPPNIVNLIDTTLIKKDIATANQLNPDIIIAVMHWGHEYHTQPSSHQKEIAQFLFNNKVRIIIGHHPHVIQPIQTYTEGDSITHAVFYSLGNFVSNQRWENSDGGMLAHIVLSKKDPEAPVTIELIDYSLVWTHKYFKDNKPVFNVLPAQDKNTTALSTPNFNLQSYEQYMMDRFVKSATTIIEEGIK